MLNKLILTLTLMLLVSNTLANDLPDFPFIIVTGEASTEAAPDSATIFFVVTEFNEDSEKAMAVVQQRSVEVLALIERFNISTDDIHSFGIDKEARRARNEDYQRLEILGYEVLQQYRVKLNEISKFSEFMNELVSMQNVSGIGTEFAVADEEQILRSLTKTASGDARRRAEDLAEAMEVKILSVHALSENESFSRHLAKFEVSSTYPRMVMQTGSRVDSFKLFVPKALELDKTVNVVFKIEP